MEILYGCPFEKITFLPRIDANSGFERDWDILWKKFKNGTFIALQMKVFDHKKFKFHAWGQKCHIRNCQSGTFDPVHGIWKFLWPNTFIWSAMNVPLWKFFHNVSQSLPNPEFVSILRKKAIFSKVYPYSISNFVS